MDSFLATAQFPHAQVLLRMGLALGMGLFVGLEREWRHKDAGVRTFGLIALLGGMGGLLGTPFGVACLVLVGALVVLMNWHQIGGGHRPVLSTSVAMLTTASVGILCGIGHTFTPVVVTIAMAWLLA